MSDLTKGWEVNSISDTFELIRDKGLSGVTPYLEIGNVNITNKKYTFTDKKSVKGCKKAIKGDVLISRVRPTRGAITQVKENSLEVSSAFTILRNTYRFNEKYLWYYLAWNDDYLNYLGFNCTGTMYPTVPENIAVNYKIPIAPLNEQCRIVAKLEKLLHRVDACKERLEKIPAILKRFRLSVLSAACSGKLTADWREKNPDVSVKYHSERSEESETLRFSQRDNFYDEFPETWVCTSIVPILSTERRGLKTGPFGTMLKKKEHQSHGIPVLGIENISFMRFIEGSKIHISYEKAEELSEYEALPGDVLISRSGTVGEVCVVPDGLGEVRISTNIIRVVLSDKIILPIFFCYLFNGAQFVLNQIHELCKGSTRDFLNQTILKTIIFPLPPLPEQQEIVRRVEVLFKKADEIEARYKKAKAFVDKLMQSILAKAFRGELVPQDPNDEPASVLLERIKSEKVKQESKKKVKKKQ